MKKYHFRLESVLKLRKIKEEKCRMELGKLISYRSLLEEQLKHDKNEISNYKDIEQTALIKGVSGNQLRAFPMLISGKESNLRLLQRDLSLQEKKIEEKKIELSKLTGDLKIVENLKEKDFEEHKKQMRKELNKKVEEQTQNWLQTKDGDERL